MKTGCSNGSLLLIQIIISTTSTTICHYNLIQLLHKMSTSPKCISSSAYSSLQLATSSSTLTSPSLTTTAVSPTSSSSNSSQQQQQQQQHKKFRPPYTRPSHRAARYIPKPMPQELGHLKTYSKNIFQFSISAKKMFS